jgi:hypothetical protein
MSTPETYTFEARCKVCRRLLGEVELPREHIGCGVVYTTKCRTNTCRDRLVRISFDQAVTTTARVQGY